MRLLVLGGTAFVGRHLAAEALARGHEVTLFHRGRTGRELFPEAEHVLGERSADLGRLAGRAWDAAADVSAYLPRQVREACAALAGAIERYCYVSTVAVYRPTGAEHVTEGSPLLDETDLADPATEEITWATYGALKALGEREAVSAFGEHALIVRPTYVIGPHDRTDRFTYWVRRAAEGGELLAPGPPETPTQLVDARDLAAFTLDLLERDAAGPYNAVGPAAPLTFGGMVEACVQATGGRASPTWVDEAFLRGHGVEVERELPLWNAPEEREVLSCDPSRSLAAGLRLRPLAESIADTLAWDRQRGSPPLADALDRTREAELLGAWHAECATRAR